MEQIRRRLQTLIDTPAAHEKRASLRSELRNLMVESQETREACNVAAT